ncbi:MAG: single-stranded DNA-binding protein [Candidatus Kapabacteria bacterium]|nr:single-stranded DNA-binding protein [Candidatus Kapabacteria bacterium]
MSRTLNKVMLIGNVGKDPDVNFTPSGVKVAQFRMATSETWKDKDGAVQEHTDWHTVIAWRGLADVVERLVRRGTRLYVEGKIQSRSFDDRDGNKRYVTEIVAENLLLLDAKRPEQSASHSETENNNGTSTAGGDEIPF